MSPAIRVWSAAALLSAAAVLPAATAPKARAAPGLRARIEGAIARARRSDGLRHAFWAVDVRSLATGKTLYAREAETSVMPASSLKLATAAAALDAFGPDARFQTTLQAAARPNAAGHLAGDVYLVGSGDPGLSRELAARPDFGAFDVMVDTLQQAGVRRIEGKLLGYDGLFAGERRGSDWTWEDLVWWYGAEVSALTFADGSAHLKVIPGAAPGLPLVIERRPPSAYYRVESRAVTCLLLEPPGLTLSRPLGRNVIELGGCLPAGAPVVERWVAVEDPALYAATVFSEALRARGIELTGGVAMAAALPADLLVIAAYDGAPVAELLKDVNKPSHNLRAEMLLRLLGVKARGQGTAEAGREAVLQFLKTQGIDTAGWDVLDGSGLSRSDLVTARGLVDLLAAMSRHVQAAAFRDSLPVAGTDGTLKRRLAGRRTSGRIQAKTGTLRHTSALAGYASPVRGDGLAFAIVVNHATAPAGEIHDAIDSVAEALFGP